jgi:putative ABC transport system substrate-binding protein
MPAIYPFRFFVTAGGLIAYETDVVDHYRQSAVYIDRILRGDRPSDLPVQVPTKYQTSLNLRTAKALGFEIPSTLLLRADEVIE